MDAIDRLLLSAELPEAVKYMDENHMPVLLKGRAEWALGYELSKRNAGSLLIVVEAKAVRSALVWIPQIVVHMMAVQNARQHENNKAVFGMLSD